MLFGDSLYEEDRLLIKLERIRKNNQTHNNWKNRFLCHFLYDEDLYATIYRLHFFGVNDYCFTWKIRTFIAFLKGGKFNSWNSVEEILLSRGKINCIGKVVRIILLVVIKAVYGSEFYYPSLTKHQVLRSLNQTFNSVDWVIVGNFSYPKIERILSFLGTRIFDDKFLLLVKAFLAIESSNLSKLGCFISQNSKECLLYTALVDLYLNRFDTFFENRKKVCLNQDHEVCSTTLILNEIFPHRGNVKCSDIRLDEFNVLGKVNSNIFRFHFLRYQCTWIVGIFGNKTLAKYFHRDILDFLEKDINIEGFNLADIISLRNRNFIFLEYVIGFNLRKDPSVIFSREYIYMEVPLAYILGKFCELGFCDRKGKSAIKNSWVYLEDNLLIERFDIFLKKVSAYYSGVDDKRSLFFLQRILVLSCIRTLAHKHHLSTLDVLRKYGKNLCSFFYHTSKEGVVSRRICLSVRKRSDVEKVWILSI